VTIRPRRLIGIIAAVAVLAIAATSPGWIRWFEVRRTFQMYADALMRNDYNRAYSFCSPEFAADTPYGTFEVQQKSLTDSHGPLKSVKQQGVSVEGEGAPLQWHATIRAELSYARKTFEVVYELRLVDGHWKLWRYHSD